MAFFGPSGGWRGNWPGEEGGGGREGGILPQLCVLKCTLYANSRLSVLMILRRVLATSVRQIRDA